MLVFIYILLSVAVGIIAGWHIKPFWRALVFVLCVQAVMCMVFGLLSSSFN